MKLLEALIKFIHSFHCFGLSTLLKHLKALLRLLRKMHNSNKIPKYCCTTDIITCYLCLSKKNLLNDSQIQALQNWLENCTKPIKSIIP